MALSKAGYQVVLFCMLFLATHFVNKYVLSVLEFKYPTIFQGWQTFVGFIMLKVLISTKYIEPMFTEAKAKHEIALWLPGMMFFVMSIYSGSKALANLPIPVFFSLHNLTTVVKCTLQIALSKMLTSIYSYCMLMLLVISSFGIINSDPQFNSEGYFWMVIHILAIGALDLYSELIKGRLKLSIHETLYCNYIYSFVILAPSSYFIGDAIEAVKFPYLYFSKFYVGCIFSGLFGVMLSLILISYRKESSNLVWIDLPKLHGIAKIITSTVSLVFFDFTFTANHAMWLLINHLAAIVCVDAKPRLATLQRTALPRVPNKYEGMVTSIDVSNSIELKQIHDLPDTMD